LGDEGEEEVVGLAFEREVADLVDDQEVVALEAAQLLLELVAVLGGLQTADPFLGGREGDAVSAFAGFQRERDREVGFAGAGWAEEADVRLLLDPGELSEVQDERPLGGGLRRPVEVLQRLQGGEAGSAYARAGTGGVAGEDLGLEQRLVEALLGPLLLARERRGLLEPLQHPRRLQLRQ
jgi:hypothetical protein